MLTWALVYLAVKFDSMNGVLLIIAMICDVMIIGAIAAAIATG